MQRCAQKALMGGFKMSSLLSNFRHYISFTKMLILVESSNRVCCTWSRFLLSPYSVNQKCQYSLNSTLYHNFPFKWHHAFDESVRGQQIISENYSQKHQAKHYKTGIEYQCACPSYHPILWGLFRVIKGQTLKRYRASRIYRNLYVIINFGKTLKWNPKKWKGGNWLVNQQHAKSVHKNVKEIRVFCSYGPST